MPDRDFETNRSFIEELASWRARFGLNPGGGADRAAAYLIHDAFLRTAFRWREEAARLADQAGSGLGLALAASRRFLEQADDGFLKRQHERRVARYEAALAEGRSEEAHAVPDDRLPEWYWLAQPENHDYARTFPTA